MSRKSGRRFEELIAWIQKSVHESSLIKVNERINDVDTGKPRQIDITIRLCDGPTEFLGIIEVRDHSRPIGVRYVEEVSGKLRSVRADAAFLVSRSGFTKTAIEKARQLGIRTLTYEEAKSENWSSWLQCRTFSTRQLKYDNSSIILFEYDKDKILVPSSRILESYKKEPDKKIIVDVNGDPFLSLPELVSKIINIFVKQLHDIIPYDGSRHKYNLIFDGQFDPSLWIENIDGIITQIGNVKIRTEFYFDCKEYPIKLMRYRTPDSPKSIAELATTEFEILGEKYIIEIIAPGAGKNIPAGSTVSFRLSKSNDF